MVKRSAKKYTPRRAYKYAVKVPRPLAMNEMRVCIEQNPNIECDGAGDTWLTMWSGTYGTSTAPNNFTFYDSPEF